MKRAAGWAAGALALAWTLAMAPMMYAQQMIVSRGAATVMVEPYAENIVRVSISLRKQDATAAAGVPLLQMNDWQMAVPNYKDGTSQILNDRRATDDAFYQVGATFASPRDEHYYGLGQNKEGTLDRRGHVLRCAHDYSAPSAQRVRLPFVVPKKGCGLVWDP